MDGVSAIWKTSRKRHRKGSRRRSSQSVLVHERPQKWNPAGSADRILAIVPCGRPTGLSQGVALFARRRLMLVSRRGAVAPCVVLSLRNPDQSTLYPVSVEFYSSYSCRLQGCVLYFPSVPIFPSSRIPMEIMAKGIWVYAMRIEKRRKSSEKKLYKD